MNKQEIYAAVMSSIIDDMRKSIEQQSQKWLEENPYWEIDGDNGHPAHCPQTTYQGALDAVCDDMLASADDCHCRDVSEFILQEAVGYEMSKNNKFKLLQDAPKAGKLPITIATAKAFFDSLTETKQ